MKINVASFETDHLTLDAGLYRRDVVKTGLFSKVYVWDLRFYAPCDKHYMTAGTMHTIEHILAYKLREYLGSAYVQTFPYGCTTGFGLITRSGVPKSLVRAALLNTINDVIPIISKDEVPALTAKECGRPTLFDLKGATAALVDYKFVLESSK